MIITNVVMKIWIRYTPAKQIYTWDFSILDRILSSMMETSISSPKMRFNECIFSIISSKDRPSVSSHLKCCIRPWSSLFTISLLSFNNFLEIIHIVNAGCFNIRDAWFNVSWNWYINKHNVCWSITQWFNLLFGD